MIDFNPIYKSSCWPLGQGFNDISFLESISSYNKGIQSHLDHLVTFKDFMSYPMYDISEILWLGIHKL